MTRPGGRFGRILLATVGLVLALAGGPLWTPSAAAQGRPEVSASISSNYVEVGEAFTVELVAMVEGDEMPTEPHLYAPNGFDVAGPRVSTRIVTNWGTGVGSNVKRGIGATWQLVARREGSYTIPAPSVVIGGQRVTAGRSMQVKVVKDTGRRRPSRRSSPFGSSPFGFPGGTFSFPFNFQLGGSAFDDLFEDDRDVMSEDGSKLRMDREPDRYVFLRAVPDKKRAVVGEQITLSFYVYYRASFEMSDRHEASLADFLRVPMLDNPGTHPPILTRVGGHRYQARLLDRMAIFPLRAGTLKTGVLTARFSGRRLGKRVERASNDVTIEVREPPTEGRPPGYRVGDVGRFRLSANVQPREIDAGDSVAVMVRLEGTGSLPHSLEVPERTGVEWLEPEKRGEVEVRDGRVGGWRTFGYVVRLHEPGKRYLGRIELPYYDPVRREYDVAEAELGEVIVRGTPVAQDADAGAKTDEPGAPVDGDPFAAIGPARLTLASFEPDSDGGIEPRTFWALVLTPPFGVVLAGALRRAARGLRRRRALKRQDARSLAERALAEMKRAAGTKARAAKAERAIHHGVEAAVGIKSRGVLLDELEPALGRAGLDDELAEEVSAVLALCQSLRFEPDRDGSAAADLDKRVSRLVKRLGRAADKRRQGKANGEAEAD